MSDDVVLQEKNEASLAEQLSDKELAILASLKNPDDTKAAPKALDDHTGFLICCAMVQNQEFAEYARSIGLNSKHFGKEAQQVAVRESIQFLESGGLPSQTSWQVLGNCDPAFFKPLPVGDLPAIKAVLSEFVAVRNATSAITKFLDDAKLGKPPIDALIQNLLGIRKTDKGERRGYSVEELMALPDPVWLIDGHIHENDYACIYGASGECKTFVALDWALSLATGKSVYDEFPVSKSAVAYVISEGQDGFKKRVRAWLQENGMAWPGSSEFKVYPHSFQLCTLPEAEALARQIKTEMGTCKAIFVDTLARNFGGNENETKDMNAFTESVDWLRKETGAAVVVVHHSGKNKQLAERGSYALRCAVNASFEVSKEGDRVWVNAMKQKDGKEIDYGLKTVYVPLIDSLVLRRCDSGPEAVPGEITTEHLVLNILPGIKSGEATEAGTMTVDQIASGIGRDSSVVRRAIGKLIKEAGNGIMKKQFGKGASSPVHYWRESLLC